MPCIGLVLAAVFLYWGTRFLFDAAADTVGKPRRQRVDPRGVGGAAVLTFSVWFWAPVGMLASTLALPALGLVPLSLMCIVLLMPSLLARWVAVPLGWPRLAWALTRVSTFTWRADRIGGAYALGMWAWRRSDRSEATRQWLEQRIAGQPVTPGVVFGMALAREADGQDALGRQLARMVGSFDQRICPDPLMPLATEFAVASALEAGEHEEALVWLEVDAHQTAATRVLDAVLRGAPAERVRRAVSMAPRTWEHAGSWQLWEPTRPQPLTPGPGTPLEQAMALHLAWLTAERPDPVHLLTVAHAWDTALTEADSVLRRQVVTDLSEGITHLDARAGGVLAEAAALARTRLQTHLELACDQLRSRVMGGGILAAEAELLSALTVVAQYRQVQALCSRTQRRIAWSAVHRALTPLAVRLFNEHDEKALSNAITRWLLEEAGHVGDERSANLHAGNLACYQPR